MENITVIGIDLAKSICHLVGINHQGRVLVKKKFKQSELLSTVNSLGNNLVVAIEACGSSHYWGRELLRYGHRPKLIPPQHVKQFRVNQKNDYNDALATGEASLRASIIPVPVKDLARQDLQHFLKIRERTIKEQTATANQLHGIFLENGHCAPKGISNLIKFTSIELLKENSLSLVAQEFVKTELVNLISINTRIKIQNDKLKDLAKTDSLLLRMQSVPGVGPVTALAIFASVPDPYLFKSGRHFAAWLGLVPIQHSTGGKTRLGSISKKGSFTQRRLLIHGARSVIRTAEGKEDQLSLWVLELAKRKAKNVAIVGLANKMARILWHIMTSANSHYEPRSRTSPGMSEECEAK